MTDDTITVTLTRSQAYTVLSALEGYEPDLCDCSGHEHEPDEHIGWTPDEVEDIGDAHAAIQRPLTRMHPW